MTLKPTITSSKGANTVLASSEWNTSVIQSDNYLQEVLSGVNADKIPGSAIASGVVLAGGVSLGSGTTAAGSFQVNGGLTVVGASGLQGGATVAGGLTVNSGTTATQALTATTGSFSSTLGVTGTTSLAALNTNGAINHAGLTVLTGGAVLAATGASFTGVPGQPAGVFLWTINGTIAAKVPYYV